MNSNKRFHALDAFRGFAAVLVFLYHMPNKSWLTANAFVSNSGLFVDLFFILSGFVIYHNYKDRLNDLTSRTTFIVNRLKRLLPLHYYTLFVLIALEMFKYVTYNPGAYSNPPFSINTFNTLYPQLFVLNATPLFVDFSWNFPNWSISAEIISYLLFVSASLWCFGKKQLTVITAVTFIIIGYLFFYLKYGQFNLVIDFGYSFMRACIGFYIGIVVYVLRDSLATLLPSISKNTYTVLEFISIVLVVIATINVDLIAKNYYYIMHIVFALLIFVFSIEKGILSHILKSKIFQKLGAWSYSIYLNQVLIIIIYNKMVLKAFPNSSGLAVVFELLTTVILCYYSYLTYTYIEKRFYKKLDKS
ncbi:acyltransferase family protein [Psychroserpens damuponensis]|uniref:acyltransferase family protein n=1 Tax=Psychroserpens damuponensis TaxID=943936 RepID=UPI00069380C6|nr:acyltransferase [Psychroserpens damuponensis]